jgi:hypothetical protein
MNEAQYQKGRGISMKPRLLFSLILCFVIPFTALASEEDDYLKAIEQETNKLGARAGADSNGGREATSAHRAGEGFSSGLSVEGFSDELQEKYTGSAVFYRKLDPRGQEEIYQEYLDGASIAEIRKKIMDRFLKR